MNLVIFAVGALCFIGLVSAVLLATAAQKFHVDVDPRVQAVLDVLPGANCGACGNPSCFSAAEAIAEGRAPITTCDPIRQSGPISTDPSITVWLPTAVRAPMRASAPMTA